MIRKRQHTHGGEKTYVAICDRCDDEYDTDETEFNEAVNAAQRAHWRPRVEGAVWHHYCPFCWNHLQAEERRNK